MAKVIGGIIGGHIVGRMGNKIYSWSKKHGQKVRDRKPIDKEVFANDPKYKRIREHCSEFARAASAVKLLKDALGDLLWLRKDINLHGEMMRKMLEVIQSDDSNERGSRKPDYGQLSSLERFDFNKDASFGALLRESIVGTIDRKSGLLEIELPSVEIRDIQRVPREVEKFRIVSAGLAIDFENKKVDIDTKTSEWMTVFLPGPAIKLSNAIPPNNRSTLFLIAGIEYQEGRYSKFDPGKFNILTIMKVDQYGEGSQASQ